MVLFLEYFKDIFLPVLAIIISTISLRISHNVEKKKEFDISIKFLDTNLFELKVDRKSDTIPDVYDRKQFRLLPYVVISNNSSYPVTIVSMSLNDQIDFGLFTRIGDKYEVTYGVNSEKQPISIIYELDQDKVLKPPFELHEFQAKAGILMFPYNSSLVSKTNIISIVTSRGTEHFKLPPLKNVASLQGSSDIQQ